MKAKTKIMLLILGAIAITIITVTIQTIVIGEKSKEEFFSLYGQSKLNVVENYLEKSAQGLENYVRDYIYWDDAFYSLEKKDRNWIQKNITKYIYKEDFFEIDLVYLSKKDDTYNECYGEEIPIIQLKNTKVYKNALKENKISHEYVMINNTLYDIAAGPITTEDRKKSNGILILGRKIDKAFLNHLKPFFMADDVKKMDIIRKDNFSNPIIYGKNKIEVYQPIKNKGEGALACIQVVYDISDYNHFKYEILKKIIITFIVYCLIGGIVVVILMGKEVAKLHEVIIQIHSIAKGNYKKRLKEKGSYEVVELSKSVNKLSKEIEKIMLKQEENYLEFIKALVTSLEVKDAYTKGHSERVAFYAYHLGKNIGYENLHILSNAALVHDIGKIAIPDRILNKPGQLTEEEYEIIKTHPNMGYKILNASNMFNDIKYIIKYHHERYDGNGYPDQIKGEDIPLGARILAVADVFDALTSDRAYRKAMPLDDAMKIIRDGIGTHFDPYLVEVFEEMVYEIQENGQIYCTEIM